METDQVWGSFKAPNYATEGIVPPFVSSRQNRILVATGLTLLIISLLLSLPAAQGGGVESAPLPKRLTPYPGCIKENNNPVEPLRFPDAWALMLNFEHAGSTQSTTACWAVRDKHLNIWYQAGIVCDVVNNTNNVLVGNGSADFDGNFHIQCPPRAGTNYARYNSFYVQVNAEIPLQSGTFPFVTHPDFQVSLDRSQDANGDWHGVIESAMGSTSFDAFHKDATLPTTAMLFNSVVHSGEAYHTIDGQASDRIKINPFQVDMTTGIEIGGGSEPWTLREIIIDPPAFCQSGC